MVSSALTAAALSPAATWHAELSLIQSPVDEAHKDPLDISTDPRDDLDSLGEGIEFDGFGNRAADQNIGFLLGKKCDSCLRAAA